MFQALQQQLAELATEETAASTRVHVRCLRGIRGVPQGALAKAIAETWRASPVELPRDCEALDALFGTAWEDGLAAVAFLAAALPSDPAAAAALGLAWAERTDDVLTADSLGWFVFGPALVHLPPEEADALYGELFGPEGLAEAQRPQTRRAAAATALAFTPAEIEGSPAAALREQQGIRDVRMVDGMVPERAGAIVARAVRDDDPAVQKVLRKVVKIWADHDPASLLAWAPTVRGGLPKLLRTELDRVKPRKAPRGAR